MNNHLKECKKQEECQFNLKGICHYGGFNCGSICYIEAQKKNEQRRIEEKHKQQQEIDEWNPEVLFHSGSGYEMRKFKVLRKTSRPNGRTSIDIRCPFCKTVVEAFVMSLAGCGKRCECGVIHTRLITIDDKNIYRNKKEGDKLK